MHTSSRVPLILFPQLTVMVRQYLREKVRVYLRRHQRSFSGSVLWLAGGDPDRHIHPDTSHGEAPEVPRYETSLGPRSTAEVDLLDQP